eukprot:TRINITY_DN2635_c1_g1_i2.p1 TRINITY_DN2635_c1_g1~~TRINITY_DN2635_c1_g1_i2.p1  ORF type:complete len:530 (-),score=138.24 TRINITY_DN2635_c1_g1_i2:236-1825(-)
MKAFFLVLLICSLVHGNNQAKISINFRDITGFFSTITTCQMVVNPMLRRGSPIHDNAFKALKDLDSQMVRMAMWFPYPHLSVAELTPPTGNPRCGTASEVFGKVPHLRIFCGTPNGIIQSIDFASFGTPEGSCGQFRKSSCDAASSMKIVEQNCLGRNTCLIPVSRDVFGDPCVNVDKRLFVQATCSNAVNTTSWDFQYMDPIVNDFMDATGNVNLMPKGRDVVASFSTSPTWMWNTDQAVPVPSDPNQVDWSYEQGTELRDFSLQDIAMYYKRLFQWYTQGGFTDEYGVYHKSGYYYEFSHWEIGNEVEDEHDMTVQYYTQVYDAVVEQLMQVDPKMKYVGMALENHYEWNWYEYFLNPKNHKANIPLDWISFHFYGISNERTNVSSYQVFFQSADQFLNEVTRIIQIRDKYSPRTKIDIDELGTILANDNVPDPVRIPNEYWTASGAMYSYLAANLALKGIDTVGLSQLVGFPTQYPSVSMVDWIYGMPNNRYWNLFLLRDQVCDMHAMDDMADSVWISCRQYYIFF